MIMGDGMRSSKSNWGTLLILFIVVLFIFIKEDAFSKEKKNIVTYLELYEKEIPLKNNKKEYDIKLDNIHIKKLNMEDDVPICTCDVTKIKLTKEYYEVYTNATFDYDKKEGTVTIDIKDNNNVLDTYIINITYQNDFVIEEECKKEYICPTF